MYALSMSGGLLGLVLWFPAALSARLHSGPGFYLAIVAGLVIPTQAAEWPGAFVCATLSGFTWVFIYGTIGLLIDRRRESN